MSVTSIATAEPVARLPFTFTENAEALVAKAKAAIPAIAEIILFILNPYLRTMITRLTKPNSNIFKSDKTFSMQIARRFEKIHYACITNKVFLDEYSVKVKEKMHFLYK